MNSFAQTQSAAAPAELAELVAPTVRPLGRVLPEPRPVRLRAGGPGAVAGTGPSRTSPHLAPAGLGLPDGRPGGRLGGGRLRPDRRGPDASAGHVHRRRPRAARPPRPPSGPSLPAGAASPSAPASAVTELVPQPGHVLVLRHLPGAHADQLGISPAGRFRVRLPPPSPRPRRRRRAPPSSSPSSAAVVFGAAVVGPAVIFGAAVFGPAVSRPRRLPTRRRRRLRSSTPSVFGSALVGVRRRRRQLPGPASALASHRAAGGAAA